MTAKYRPTVAIIYGFAEGPLVGKYFRRLLHQKGFRVITDPQEADIIVTHSGGVYYLPQDLQGKTVLIVAPTYWRFGDSLIKGGLSKIRQEAQHAIKKHHLRRWFEKAYINTMYVFGDVPASVRMFQTAKIAGKDLPLCNAKRVGVISHHNDAWSGYIQKVAVEKYLPYCLISHAGSHDDIWIHPKDYVAVIQYLYES
ncbi:MAG TPA: hypothetical protein VFT16_00875 [Candidatus Saccharimonadales bacterium]|nr:hypothetical protein [Candidatus Saccharimonadales bacterium]